MPPDDSLTARFLAGAASEPETPCLFYPDGLDWRWLSRRQLAAGVVAWARQLAVLPPGSRAAFHDRPRPAAVALDLALLAAGLTAVPVAAPALWTGEGCWVEEEGGGAERPPAGAAAEPIRLSSWPPPPAPDPGFVPRAGAAAVVSQGTAADVIPEARLLAAAERLAAEVAAAPRLREPYEIAVSFRPLADPGERALRTWAFVSGAAMLLEPLPNAGLASVAWARPTLFAGTVVELAHLRLLAEAGGARRPWRRRPRLPFGRLRLVLVLGTEPLPELDAAFWAERGTKVAPWSPVV